MCFLLQVLWFSLHMQWVLLDNGGVFPYTHLLHVFKQLHCDNFFTIQVIITSNCVTMFGSWASFNLRQSVDSNSCEQFLLQFHLCPKTIFFCFPSIILPSIHFSNLCEFLKISLNHAQH